jgi:hypothetical protein
VFQGRFVAGDPRGAARRRRAPELAIRKTENVEALTIAPRERPGRQRRKINVVFDSIEALFALRFEARRGC